MMILIDRIKRNPCRTFWFLGGGLFLIFIIWYNILPVPLFQDPYATVLLDREGQVMGMKVADDGQMRFEEVQDLPPRYVISVLVFEDRYFLAHQGVNWWALCRALVQNIQAGHVVSGGSTLSMQVVRLALGNPPRTVPEKIREIFLTLRMEQSYSKKQILEMYASHAPFGGNVVGIRAAALKYFNRRPEQLSWAEAALLAVLPNAPALLYPGKNNTLLKQKRDGLLAKLYREGVMSEDSYHLALAEPLPEKKFDIPTVAPHLLAKAYRERKGKVCPTYIDGRLQKKINEIVERHTALLSQNYIYNMAVLVAHVPTGEVRAYVGNSAPRKGSRGNDVDIVQAVRSSGSILKPALYACMLQSGFILPGTLVPDIPSRFGSYSPSNFNRDFKGVVPARQALAQSLNIPFVRLLKDYSYARFYDDLKQLGIRSLNRDADHYGLSLILGGAETSLWDICNLYGGMSAVLNHYNDRDGQYFDGEYSRLKVWEEYSGAEGQDEEEKKISADRSVLKASAIWQTMKALEEVERPEMESGWKNFVSAMNLAWKTGTSFGFRDAWAVGVTPRYAVGVWVGNATGEGKPGLVGAQTAGPVLFDIFNLLPSSSWFTRPVGIFVEAEVCRKSGHLKGRFCDETDTLLVLPAGLRTEACPYHHLVTLSADESQRIYENCANTEPTLRKSWFTLPPVWEWYYKQHHPEYKPLPPFKAGCGEDTFQPMQFIYPPMNARIKLPKQLDGSKGFLTVELAHNNPNATVFWHLDETYQAQTQDFHKISLQPAAGKHSLTAVDGEGNTISTTFFVE